MAIALGEQAGPQCAKAFSDADVAIVSAATMAEALIVGQLRHVAAEVQRLLEQSHVRIVVLTEASARRAAFAYAEWGKGVHPAGLNYGDCFAYEVAMQNGCPLLYIGNDFSQTDVKSAL